MKKLLNKVNGKKTFIGLAVYFLASGAYSVGLISESLYGQISMAASALVGVGFLHKVKKAI